MPPTLFLPAALQLTATVLLAIAPFVSATASPSQPGRHSRDVALPDGWKAVGCYTDSPSLRTLTSFLWTDYDHNNMTVGWCINYCIDQNKAFAGLEDGNLCFCGNVLTPSTITLPPDDCLTTRCAGDKNEYCGGPNALMIYWNGMRIQSQPTMLDPVSSWNPMGCYKDSNDARTLTHSMGLTGPNQWLNSAEYCINSCASLGYSIAGMEFAVECWCGNTINHDRHPLDDWAPCMLACPGNSLEICGGHNAMTIYIYW